MMTDTEITIELDRVHRAVRSADRWALMKRKPDGSHDSIAVWSGGRRALFHRLEELGIGPGRGAVGRPGQLPGSGCVNVTA